MLLILLVALSLGSLLADEPQYPFPVNCEEPRLSNKDNIPYCIKGREDPVYGHCKVQDAICKLKTTRLSIVMLLILLAALFIGSVIAVSIADEPQYPLPVNCEEPRWCHLDLTPHCIKGRRDPVHGHCEVQDAICNGEKLDPSNSCFLPYAVRCDLSAGQRPCFRDLRPFCVVGRSKPVRGHCAIQRAICDENAVFEFTNSCLQSDNLRLPLNN